MMRGVLEHRLRRALSISSLAALAPVAASCTENATSRRSGPPEHVGSVSQSVQNGGFDVQRIFSGVVRITGAVGCSGVMVSPDVVLLAETFAGHGPVKPEPGSTDYQNLLLGCTLVSYQQLSLLDTNRTGRRGSETCSSKRYNPTRASTRPRMSPPSGGPTGTSSRRFPPLDCTRSSPAPAPALHGDLHDPTRDGSQHPA